MFMFFAVFVKIIIALLNRSFLSLSFSLSVGLSRWGFSVALEPILELTLVDQAGLELRDPPASAS